METLELRSVNDFRYDGKKITGYAIVWDSPSEKLGNFREIIKPGAATDILNSGKRISANLEHRSEYMLGSTADGTLKLTEDQRGLAYEIDPPDTSYARDLLAVMAKNPKAYGASFGFTVAAGGSNWRKKDGETFRDVKKFSTLSHITVTNGPAYPETSAALRSLDEWEQSEKYMLDYATALKAIAALD